MALPSFEPISVSELRQQFLDYHKHVLNSAFCTVDRYRMATQHLENYVAQLAKQPRLNEVRPDSFAVYLRKLEVAANVAVIVVFAWHLGSAKHEFRQGQVVK